MSKQCIELAEASGRSIYILSLFAKAMELIARFTLISDYAWAIKAIALAKKLNKYVACAASEINRQQFWLRNEWAFLAHTLIHVHRFPRSTTSKTCIFVAGYPTVMYAILRFAKLEDFLLGHSELYNIFRKEKKIGRFLKN